jgi:hypothetical protein
MASLELAVRLRGFPDCIAWEVAVAKIFDLDRFTKWKRGKKSSGRSAEPLDAERPGVDKVLPINMGKGRGGSWPVSSADTSLHVGAAFLLVIGILCGLYLGGSDKKPAIPKADKQSSDQTPQQPMPARSLAKPSPIVPVDGARPESSTMAKDASPKAVPMPAAPRFTPTRFEATHKKVFGGCTGQLELTAARLHFSCPNQPDLNLPVDVIAKAHKDGVVLRSGEKYHFVIANHTKDQAEAIFESWLSRVQQMPQPGRAAAF